MTDQTTVQFLDKTYAHTVEGPAPENAIQLSSMSVEELLSLRNLVAANLGAGEIKGFKDHAVAVTSTWKALAKFAEEVAKDPVEEKAAKAPKEKKVREPKAPKEPRDPIAHKLEKDKIARPKCLSAEIPKRPSQWMFSRYEKLRDPAPGSARSFAWPNYKASGERIIDVMIDPERHADKIRWWAKQDPPYMKIIEIDEETFLKECAEFCEKHGIPNPGKKDKARKEELEKLRAEKAAAKAKAAEEKAAAKAKAAEEKAAAKAKADAAKIEAARAKAEAAKAKADAIAAAAEQSATS